MSLDPNSAAYGPSNDQVKWSFKYGVGFDRTLFGDNHARFNLFGETRAGSPFSYTFQDATGSRSSVFGTTGSNSRYLFYVPTINDPLVTYDSVATQAAVEAIITGSGLANYRGKIAPRNAFLFQLSAAVLAIIPLIGCASTRRSSGSKKASGSVS